MTEEMKEKLQTTQRGMMRMTTQTKNNSAAAHSANVDEAVDDEPRDTEIVSEEGTTEANPQDPLEKDESNQDADSNSIFRPSTTRPFRTRIGAMGLQKMCEQATTQTTCWQLGFCHGFSDRAGCLGSKQERLPNTTTAAGQKLIFH